MDQHPKLNITISVSIASPRLLENLDLMDFWKANRIGTNLTSGRMVFQRTGVTAEKTHLLGSIKGNSVADGTCNIFLLLDLMGWLDVTQERWSLK